MTDQNKDRLLHYLSNGSTPSNGTASREDVATIDWEEPFPWPSLDRAALYGLAGEIVEAVAPITEAAPVGMLLTLLVAFGNAAGDATRAYVGDDRHPPRLFAALVGKTSSGGKGTSLSAVRPIFRTADDAWLSAAEINGFASGEAIVARLGGYHSADNGAPVEKRAFVIEQEFSRLLTVNARDGSTASPVLRQAWDVGRLQTVRAKQNLLAEGAHLSLLAHITPDELRAKMTATDIAGGFANRVLFACVRREKKLPSPPRLDQAVVGKFGKRLRQAIDFARDARELQRTPEAETLWAELYHAEPERDGIVGEVTARAAAQKLRLSVAYALLDRASSIRPEHVLAAEAVWRYCAASVEHLFGGLCGDHVQDELLGALRSAHPSGLTGAQQHGVFHGKMRAERLDVARTALEARFLIRTEREATDGRSRIVSYAERRTGENIRKKSRDELFIRLSSLIRARKVSEPAESPAPCPYHCGPAQESCQRCGRWFAEHHAPP